ncbi:MAG: hypothetical protein RIG61_05425 [Deltaproteobacteria bacterium]
MADVEVKELKSDEGGWEYDVLVREDDTESAHAVTVGRAYYESLTGAEVPPDKLVKKSFEFLLEREPKESIMSRFDLTVISNYFPEYESRIKDYF